MKQNDNDAERDVTLEAAVKAFRELAWMLGRGLIMSVYLYADESGTHDVSAVVIIAGLT